MFSCSPCVPVGGAGCVLLGGLELKMNLTVLGIGIDRMEILHRAKGGVDRLEILHSIASTLGRFPKVAFVKG